MTGSNQEFKTPYRLARDKMRSWHTGPEERLDRFMRASETCIVEFGLELQDVHEGFLDPNQYAALKEQLVEANSEKQREDINTELAALIKAARKTLDKFVESTQLTNQGGTNSSAQLKLIEQIEQELKNSKQAMVEKEYLRAVSEFFEKNEGFIQGMESLRNILLDLQQQDRIESLKIKQYILKLNNFIATYRELNLIDCINSNDTPAKALIALDKKIQGEQFRRYASGLSEMAAIQEEISRRLAPYEEKAKEFAQRTSDLNQGSFVSLASYALTPVQYVPRLAMLLTNVQKRLTDKCDLKEVERGELSEEALQAVNHSLEVLRPMASEMNKKIHERVILQEDCAVSAIAKMSGQSKSQRKITLLQAILELNLNNPLEQSGSIQVSFFDTYLKNLLAQAYPRDFNFKGTLFCIDPGGELARNSMQYKQILDALGVHDTRAILFDPALFNAEKLDELFKQDRNPLWLVLKSTIPVSRNFSATEKITSYIDVASEFYAGRIGGKGKYLGALSMAKAAYEVQTTNQDDVTLIDRAFMPFQSTVKNSELCQQRQFGNWIVAKHQEHAAPASRNRERFDVSEGLRETSFRKRGQVASLPQIPTAWPDLGTVPVKELSDSVIDVSSPSSSLPVSPRINLSDSSLASNGSSKSQSLRTSKIKPKKAKLTEEPGSSEKSSVDEQSSERASSARHSFFGVRRGVRVAPILEKIAEDEDLSRSSSPLKK